MGMMRFRVFPTHASRRRWSSRRICRAWTAPLGRCEPASRGGNSSSSDRSPTPPISTSPGRSRGMGRLTLTSGSLMERPEPYLVAAGTRPRHDRPGPQPALRLAGDRAGGARGGAGQAGGGRGAIFLGGGRAGRAGRLGRARRGGLARGPRRRRPAGRRLRRTGAGRPPPQRRQSHQLARRRSGHRPCWTTTPPGSSC